MIIFVLALVMSPFTRVGAAWQGNALQVEPDVQRHHRVGQGTDRDHIHPGSRVVGDILEVDTA